MCLQSPGHPNCDNFSGPIQQPLKDFSSVLGYHWHDMAHQNRIARSIVERFGAVYFDVEWLTSLRPDGHNGRGDCLHYCHPGIASHWVKLLHNFMIKLLPESN